MTSYYINIKLNLVYGHVAGKFRHFVLSSEP